MKLTHWIGLGLATAILAVGADYTVPRTWTVNGAAFAKNALLIFDPLNTDLPVELRVRVKTPEGEPPTFQLSMTKRREHALIRDAALARRAEDTGALLRAHLEETTETVLRHAPQFMPSE